MQRLGNRRRAGERLGISGMRGGRTRGGSCHRLLQRRLNGSSSVHQ